jgi:hypothetical protein
MAVPTDRKDITEKTDSHERIDANPRKLPTEANDAAEPMELTDRIEPTDPMERTDPLELMDSKELVELIDHREFRLVLAIPPVCQERRPLTIATALHFRSGRSRTTVLQRW